MNDKYKGFKHQDPELEKTRKELERLSNKKPSIASQIGFGNTNVATKEEENRYGELKAKYNELKRLKRNK